MRPARPSIRGNLCDNMLNQRLELDQCWRRQCFLSRRVPLKVSVNNRTGVHGTESLGECVEPALIPEKIEAQESRLNNRKLRRRGSFDQRCQKIVVASACERR